MKYAVPITKDISVTDCPVIEVRFSFLDCSDQSRNHLVFTSEGKPNFSVFVKAAPNQPEMSLMASDVTDAVRELASGCSQEAHEEAVRQCLDFAKCQVGTYAVKRLKEGLITASHHYVTIDPILIPIANSTDSWAGYELLLCENGEVLKKLNSRQLQEYLIKDPRTPIYQTTNSELISYGECVLGSSSHLDSRKVWSGSHASLLSVIDKDFLTTLPALSETEG